MKRWLAIKKERNRERWSSGVKNGLVDGLREEETKRVRKQEERKGVDDWRGEGAMVSNKKRKKIWKDGAQM